MLERINKKKCLQKSFVFLKLYLKHVANGIITLFKKT